jgi:hypothetical protein
VALVHYPLEGGLYLGISGLYLGIRHRSQTPARSGTYELAGLYQDRSGHFKCGRRTLSKAGNLKLSRDISAYLKQLK